MINWTELEQNLMSHDYTYEFSDDFRVWTEGTKHKEYIKSLLIEAIKEDRDKALFLIEQYASKYGTNFKEVIKYVLLGSNIGY